MSELIPSLGCLVLLFLGLPIWAIREARQSKKRQELLNGRVDDFSSRLRTLEARLLELKRDIRLSAPEPMPSEPVGAATPPEAPPPRIEEPAPPPPRPEPAAIASSPAPPPLDLPPPPPSPAIPEPSARGFDWESLISVRAFAWLGGAALFLGAALFFQYAIQHGLISPAMRVVIGLLVGSAALVWGDSRRVRSTWAAQAASGAGIAVLYASFFAAHARYGLLGQPATFAAMALVTVIAGILAVRRQSTILAVLGTVGGFLTPYLLATDEDHPIGLLLYVLALDVGLLAVTRARRWLWLPFLGLAGSGLLYAGWASRHLDSPKLPFALGAAILLSVLFIFGLRGQSVASAPPGMQDFARTSRAIAAVAPFFAALATAGDRKLALSPAILVVYLLVLIALTDFVSREAGLEALVPIAGALAILAVVIRSGSDLFPAHREAALAVFVLIPLVLFLVWLRRRDAPAAGVLRLGAAIGLFGTYLVAARVIDVEPRLEPVLPVWLFVAAGAAGLVAIGMLERSGGWILAAEGLLFVALLTLAVSFERARLSEFLPLVLIPAAVFWALPFATARGHADRLAWFSAGIAPVAAFGALYWLAKPVWGTDRLGIASIVFGALSFVALRRTLTMDTGDPEERQFTTALFGAVTLLFLTAAIPILLDKEWITVAWALEAAALAWLSTRVPEPALVKVVVGLAAAVFVRLVFNPALWGYHPRSATMIFNWYLYTFGIPAVALLVAAHWLRNDAAAKALRAPDLLRVFAGILVFVLLNVEIADFYSTGERLRFRPAGGGLAQDMTYSLAWGIFALGLLALGISRKSKPTRAAALVVLMLTVGKVFLHDLWDLGALYRVGSIVGLAVALLAVSFLTQRYVFSRAER